MDRTLLRHFVAAIAYRTQKALRGAPPHYPHFSAGHQLRTPVEILRHMTSVLGYARTFFVGGIYPITPEPLVDFAAEQGRFHEMLASLDALLAEAAIATELTDDQLLQGPLADAMTHVGQLALLRRLAGDPVAPENFIRATVRPGGVGMDQPEPVAPDAVWPEAPPGRDA